MSAAKKFYPKQGATGGLAETRDSGPTQLDLEGLAARLGFFSNQSAQPPFFITSNLKHSLSGFQTASQ